MPLFVTFVPVALPEMLELAKRSVATLPSTRRPTPALLTEDVRSTIADNDPKPGTALATMPLTLLPVTMLSTIIVG